jgi:hypothetical protein
MPYQTKMLPVFVGKKEMLDSFLRLALFLSHTLTLMAIDFFFFFLRIMAIDFDLLPC